MTDKSKKVYAITGANGFVGSACVEEFRSAGHTVLSLQRKPGIDSLPFHLGQAVDPQMLQNIDVLIHSAYDFSAFGYKEVHEINVQGSIRLFEAARQAGVKKIIFISTVSAFAGCKSLYGKGKLEVEDYVKKIGGTIVRPGLVYGSPEQGMFGSLYKMVGLPALPVFSGGKQNMFLVHVQDLAKAIATVAEQTDTAGKIYTVAHPEPIPFRDILKTIAHKRARQVLLVPFPTPLALLGFRTLECAGLRLRFRSDNLLGLVYVNPSHDFSDLSRLSISLRPFRDSI